MGTERGAACAAMFLAFTLSTPLARAQDDDARAQAARLFKEASTDYAEGRPADAAPKFEASHRLVPRAAAIYSAARAWDASGALDRAADDYEGALERTDLHGAEADDARKRLEEVGARVGVVALQTADDAHVWIGHVQNALGSVRVHLVPGDYDARVERSGFVPWSNRVHVDAGQVVRVEATLAPVAVLQPAPPEHHVEARPRDRTVAWVSVAVAAGAAVVSAVLYAETVHARDQFEASGNADAHLRDAATAWRTATYVGYGVAGAAAGTGAVLFVW
ncbi:MAG TPA: PEGA domain-containing protein [Polyangiaceae bacterium]|jgi:hypothetical protein